MNKNTNAREQRQQQQAAADHHKATLAYQRAQTEKRRQHDGTVRAPKR